MALQLVNTVNWSGPNAAGMGKTTIPPVEAGMDTGGLLDTVWRGLHARGVPRNNVGPNALGQPRSLVTPVAPLIITQAFYAQTGRLDVLFNVPDPTATVVVAGTQGVAASATGPNSNYVPVALARPGAIGMDFSAAYNAVFGTPTIGNRIFVSLTPMNPSGVAGPTTIISAVVNVSSTIPGPLETSTSVGTVTATFTGGGSFTGYAFLADGSVYNGTFIAVAPGGPSTSPLTFTGLVSGTTVSVRMTDGVAWGQGGTFVTVM